MKLKGVFNLFLWFLTISFAQGQLQKTIHGTVKNAYGNPINGATINIKETGKSTITDNNGMFSIVTEDSLPFHLECYSEDNKPVEKVLNIKQWSNPINIQFTMSIHFPMRLRKNLVCHLAKLYNLIK